MIISKHILSWGWLKTHFNLLILGSIIIFGSSFSASSQGYESHFTKIIDDKGDAPSATFSIVEDSRGFIWFGTVDGLYRYDGYNFKIYRFQKNNSKSLGNNTIRALAIDKNDAIWIATQGGGLNVLNVETETFKQYIHTGKAVNEIRGNEAWSVTLDKQGNVWVGITGKGVDRLTPSTGHIDHFNVLPGDSNQQAGVIVRSLAVDRDGYIWVGTSNNGISQIDPVKGFMTNYHASSDGPHSLSSNKVYNIYEDPRGKIWLSTFGGGLNILDKKTRQISQIRQNTGNQNSLVSDLTYGICAKSDDEFLVATQYGMSEVNLHTQKFISYRHDECNPNSLSEDRLRTIFIDKNGIIWIGSESGVDKLIRYNKFILYRHSEADPNSLEKGIVRSILEDNEGTLWFGLIDRGLVCYSKPANRFINFFHDPAKPQGLPGNHITALCQDSNGDIWIGEWDSGLFHYLQKNGPCIFEPVVSMNSKPVSISDNRIQFIREAKPGLLWLGTENGLNLYDIKKKSCLRFNHEPGNVNSLLGNGLQSNAFAQEENGDIWLGSWASGLTSIKFTNGEYTKPVFKNWQNNPSNPLSLNNNNVISLLRQKNGIIWIGTFGGGLDRFDPSTESFKHFTTNDGLPNNIVYAIQDDPNGNLWLSTDKGISKFSTKDEHFENYGKENGLQDDHFFWGSTFKSKDGEILFGGINGINSFYPEKIKADSFLSAPVLINLKKFVESDTLSIGILGQPGIELPYDDNFLSFEYSALDFHLPSKNQYEYILEGFDSKWTKAGNRRFATYTNLPHGTYTFRLKASNYDGIVNANELKFVLIIRPPWWKTWWARTIFISLFTIIVAAFYYLRVGILESQKKKLGEQVRQRTTEIENKNIQLEDQQGKISQQNDVLNNQKNELSSKNTELQETLQKLERAQKALIESEKMASLGILSAGVAHEINNPLNFISVSIQNIKSELAEMSDDSFHLAKEKISIINDLIAHSETGVDRIVNIVKSMRSYTHKSDGDLEITNINELIETSCTILSSKIPSFVSVEHVLEKVPDIRGKQDQLIQVFLNILDNAIDAILENSENKAGRIIIETTTKKNFGANYVYIGIFNSGNSIKEKLLKHLFDPFFTTKAPNKGTGLGLYISYNIIKEHKGIIEVENKHNGVLFKIYLPC